MPEPLRRLLMALLLWGLAANGAALTLHGSVDEYALGPHYTYLQDPAGSVDFEQAVRAVFQPLRDGTLPNLGYSDAAVWLRVPLHNTGGPAEWLLELPFPTLDDVRVYLRSRTSGALLQHWATGDRRPFSERPLAHRHFVFPLRLPPGEELELLLRIRSEGSLTAGAFLRTPERFYRESRDNYAAVSLYFGVLGALLIYNLMLFVSLRDRTYLLYVLFVAAMTLAQGAWHGLFFEYLWPRSPDWGNLAAVVGFDATGLFGALFSRSFLNASRYAPLLDRMILLCAGAFAALLVLAPLLPYQPHAIATSLTGVAFSVVAVAGGTRCVVHGWRPARYFLVAWAMLLIGTAALGARNLGLVPTNFFTLHAMQIGSALEMLLLSFALAERIADLRRKRDAAEASSRTKDDVLATISHEMRTPLTVVAGNASLLLQEPLAPPQRERVRALERASAQLQNLIGDLMDLSRVRAGQAIELERQPLDLRSVVDDVASLLEGAANAKGLAFEVRCGTLPPAVLGDGGRIRQVLLNLVGNAVKFTEQGSVTVAVTVERQVGETATVRFAVSDTGVGIDAEESERLFQPFTRLRQKRRQPGTGLGLAISRQLVDAMEGDIGFTSEPGRGSRFWFTLSLPILSAAALISDTSAAGRVRSLSILLVEDVPEVLAVLRAILEHEGHRVTAVGDGTRALSAVADVAFDLVLTDLHMPEMDGYELSRRIRAAQGEAAPPIFALTANVTARAAEACREAGIEAVVAKPLRLDDLNGKLSALFGAGDDEPEGEWVEQEPVLQHDVLDNYLAVLGAEGAQGVAESFGRVAAERLHAVEAALAQGDCEGTCKAAHRLAGSAATVGLAALAAQARLIENAAEEGRLADPARLGDVHRRSVRALDEWCRRAALTAQDAQAAGA